MNQSVECTVVRRRGKWDLEMVILGVLTALILLFLITPILMVVLVSFSAGDTLQFPPPRWGLRWYLEALDLLIGPNAALERFRESLLTSLSIGCVVMSIAAVIGIPAAYALTRIRFKGKLFVEQMISLPIVFPVIVLGVALLVMVSQLGIEVVFWRIVVAHVIITFAFVVRNCTASLSGISPSLEEAAYTLGANWRRSFVGIVLPLMRPGILSGMLLAFALSFNHITTSYFLSTVDLVPLPVWLIQRNGVVLDLTTFSVSSIVICIDVVLIWVLDRLMGKSGLTV
jgi:putative spermidine/putrescine transport system permease protein